MPYLIWRELAKFIRELAKLVGIVLKVQVFLLEVVKIEPCLTHCPALSWSLCL